MNDLNSMLQTKQIFIVDDDPFWTALLQQILTDQGYQNITCFTNGKDCLEHLDSHSCIIFLDYQMEEVNGIEVLKSIKAKNANNQVLFCTGYEDLSVAIEAIEYGSKDYLLKSNVSGESVQRLLQGIQLEENSTVNT